MLLAGAVSWGLECAPVAILAVAAIWLRAGRSRRCEGHTERLVGEQALTACRIQRLAHCVWIDRLAGPKLRGRRQVAFAALFVHQQQHRGTQVERNGTYSDLRPSTARDEFIPAVVPGDGRCPVPAH